jgi:hypothetical protein
MNAGIVSKTGHQHLISYNSELIITGILPFSDMCLIYAIDKTSLNKKKQLKAYHFTVRPMQISRGERG